MTERLSVVGCSRTGNSASPGREERPFWSKSTLPYSSPCLRHMAPGVEKREESLPRAGSSAPNPPAAGLSGLPTAGDLA